MRLTGQSVWHLPNVIGLKAPPELVLLPRTLHKAGYVTYHCGKSSNACRYGSAAFDLNVEAVNPGSDDMRRQGEQIAMSPAAKFVRGHHPPRDISRTPWELPAKRP